jgi:hypothetical protein
MAIAVLLLVIFGMDLAIKVPFGGQSGMMDIGFLICAAALGYLSWSSFREQF